MIGRCGEVGGASSLSLRLLSVIGGWFSLEIGVVLLLSLRVVCGRGLVSVGAGWLFDLGRRILKAFMMIRLRVGAKW